MKKIVILALAIGLMLSACLPASVTDVPAPAVDLNATADVFVQQTLQALPSITTAPTNTPVVVAETATTAPSETATVQAETSTLTGTVVTSTETLSTITITNTPVTFTSTQTTTTITPTVTLTFTPNPVGVTATETLHARFYGTLPPNIPYNSLELINKSKAEAYISLQVTIADGSTTILEYPVGGLFSVQAPVGKYKYVAWVGGNKITGSFTLDKNHDLRITIYKDRIEVKAR